MKAILTLLVAAMLCLTASPASAATRPSSASPSRGEQIARSISLVTGVAISPLLGVSAVGAWDYFRHVRTPKEERGELSWYARPLFWIPALLLVGVVALKDVFGTALPPGLKKPADVAETIENKISGLVAAGAFVPMVMGLMGAFSPGESQSMLDHSAGSLFAAIGLHSILDVILTPFAIIAFLLVWMAGHAINILILLSPFGAVDAALKALRLFLLSLVAGTSFANPYFGAVFALGFILFSYFVAGWAFRLTVCGAVYTWDFLTRRHKRFAPSENGNWMFAARQMEDVPLRTYGRLVRRDDHTLVFEYRPWLVLPTRSYPLPPDRYVIGRGLFCPEFMTLNAEGEKNLSVFVLPPRYRTHEEQLARACGLGEVRDVGLLRGFKAIWRWLKSLFGFGSEGVASAAPA